MENFGIYLAVIVASLVWFLVGINIGSDLSIQKGLHEGHCAHVKEWSVNEGDRVVTYKCGGKK